MPTGEAIAISSRVATATISTAAAPAQPGSVSGVPGISGSRDEHGAFAAALNRACSNDCDSRSTTATTKNQDGPRASSQTQSRPAVSESTRLDNARRATSHPERAPEQDDYQEHPDKPAAAQNPGQSSASPVQPTAVPVQAPVCLPQIPPNVNDSAVDAPGFMHGDSATREIAAEPQPTTIQSPFTPPPDCENIPIVQTEVPADAHAPSTSPDMAEFSNEAQLSGESDHEFEPPSPDAARIAAAPLASPILEVSARPASTTNSHRHNVPADAGITPTQFPTASPQPDIAPDTDNLPTDESPQPSASPFGAMDTNIATQAAVQATLATTVAKNARVDQRGPATMRTRSQQAGSLAPGARQAAPRTASQSGRSTTVLASPVKVEFAPAEQKNDENSDVPSDDSQHASAPAIIAIPSSTSAPPSPSDSGTAHIARVDAAPKEAIAPDPTPANPAAIAARAAETVRNAEMHLGWRSDQLGRVDIHAELRGHEVAAAMRVEDAAGRQWLSAELPHLVEALSRQDLRVASLNVADFANHSASSQSGSHSGTPQQQRWSADAPPNTDTPTELAAEELIGGDTATPHGLSIHV